MPKDFSQANLIPRFGMYALPYATVYPDLAAQLAALYRDRAGQIPWLPAGWLAGVLSYHADESGNVLVPAMSVGIATDWLDTPDKRLWWGQFTARANAVIVRYAAAQAAAGRRELDRLYAASEFWDTAYRIAYTLSAPVRGLQAVVKNPWSFGALALAAVGAWLLLPVVTAAIISRKRK